MQNVGDRVFFDFDKSRHHSRRRAQILQRQADVAEADIRT